MYIEEQITSIKKKPVSLNNETTSNLVSGHLREILLASEENQEFSPDAKQIARYLDACGDCV